MYSLLKIIRADVFRKLYFKHTCAPTHQHRKFLTFYGHRETCEVFSSSQARVLHMMWRKCVRILLHLLLLCRQRALELKNFYSCKTMWFAIIKIQENTGA